jgi:predicted N-acetyltransferase YhbS
VNLDRIRRHLDDERRYLARDGETVHVLPYLTRVVRDSRRMVSWSSLDEANADAVIAQELQQHRTADVAFEWKLYGHDGPADLLARLQRQGLIAGAPEAVLVYDLAAGPPPGPADQFTIMRITRPDQIEDYRRVAEEALGKDYGLTSGELADGLAQGSTQHLGYIAYEGTEPVGIGRLYTHPLSVFGGLYGGTVREQYRGRGIYRALVAARAMAAMELGARYLMVDALPTSRPILGRLGFGHLDDTIPCEIRR